MNTPLGRVREETRREVEVALAEAEQRLEALRAEVHDLEDEVRLARAWLGQEATPAERVGGDPVLERHTLHDAMKIVLEEQGDAGMRPSDLAEAVTDRGLYRMRDGRPTSAHQVQARVNNYPKLFVRVDGLIRLRQEEGS